MNIWVLHNSEILPIDGENVRLQRVGIISSLLSKRNHNVVWWTSTFDHLAKKQRFDKDTTVNILENYKIILLKTPGYCKNISIKRMWDHHIMSKRFIQESANSGKPDIIFTAFPTIDLSKVAVDYGITKNVPVVVDVRDYWPDIFIPFIPKFMRWAGRLVLRRYFIQSKYIFRNATALFAHAPKFLDWGLNRGQRKRGSFDNHFPFGYETRTYGNEEIQKSVNFWENLGIKQDDGFFNIVFLGTIGYLFDFDTLIEAVQELTKKNSKVRLVLCGTGEKVEELKEKAKGEIDIIFPGWVNANQIYVLLRRSHLGVYPVYQSDVGTLFGSFDTIPNKVPEYLSEGLPVACALSKGYLHDYIDTHIIGFNYSSQKELLVKGIESLIQNPGLHQSMATNARTIFENNFRAEKVYGQLIDSLEYISGKGNKN